MPIVRMKYYSPRSHRIEETSDLDDNAFVECTDAACAGFLIIATA